MNTLSELIASFPSRAGIAVQFKKDEGWQSLLWPEYFQLIVNIAGALRQLGVGKETQVAIQANTRLEWAACDLALMGLGAISIPLYHTASQSETEQILELTECEVIIVENRLLLKNLMPIVSAKKSLRYVILMEPGNFDMSMFLGNFIILPWDSFLKEDYQSFATQFALLCQERRRSEALTIIFTSGTTGEPKGVVLTHDAAHSEVTETFLRMGVHAGDSTLSFLPYSHILGRIENWGHCFSGYTMSFAESLEKIRQNLLEIRPTMMVAVPRIFEKIHSTIEAQLQGSPLQRTIANQAIEIGILVSEQTAFNRNISISQALQYEVAKRVVLNKIKNAFGGRLKFAISGGAPLNIKIAKFFHACGILILEGYGLTETTAAVCVNTPTAFRFGTVGKPIGDVQIKLAADSEILIKSRKVMLEYYKNPKATAETVKEGWFHSGDIGELSSDGYLTITDRKKDLIKTAGGKYVAPQKIEALVKAYGAISNILIYGDQKKFIVALVTLDKSLLIGWAKSQNIKYKNYEALTQSNAVFEYIRNIISQVNSQLANFESIKRFRILPQEFSIEDGELTPSLKVKRKVLTQKYLAELDKLYL